MPLYIIITTVNMLQSYRCSPTVPLTTVINTTSTTTPKCDYICSVEGNFKDVHINVELSSKNLCIQKIIGLQTSFSHVFNMASSGMRKYS